MRKRFRNLRTGRLSVALCAIVLAACGTGAGTPLADSAATGDAATRPERRGLIRPMAAPAAAEAAPRRSAWRGHPKLRTSDHGVFRGS
jgi:hypothetical protein